MRGAEVERTFEIIVVWEGRVFGAYRCGPADKVGILSYLEKNDWMGGGGDILTHFVCRKGYYTP